MNKLAQQFAAIELVAEDFNRHVPNLDFSKGGSPATLAHEYLDACNASISTLHQQNYHSEHILGIRSQMMDRLLVTLFKKVESEVLQKTGHTGPFATLMAQGGYGRCEMNVFSDLDLLFIYPKKKGPYIESLTEGLLYLLWDLKLDVGYATRTIQDCKNLMTEDVTIMTALLDLRYLCGDRAGNELKTVIDNHLATASVRRRLIRLKQTERQNRIEKHGGSVFVLEPNVKENYGSLRDIQTVLWIAKILRLGGSLKDVCDRGFMDKDEYQDLLLSQNFLWRIRNELHLLAGKKNDVLSFQRQETVSSKLGFRNAASGILGVEKFMQTYYQLAYKVATITDATVRRMTRHHGKVQSLLQRIRVRRLDDTFRLVDGQISVSSPEVFIQNPLKIIEIFNVVQKQGTPIHPDIKDWLRKNNYLVDNKLRADPEAIKLFRQMMNQYKNLGMALLAMHEVHILDQWFPEFKKLRFRVQHDIYHIYTIDTHSIFAVNELSKLFQGAYGEQFQFFREVLLEINQPELLTMGLFLHDIGKGEGGNHSVKGAKIAEAITKRLCYSAEEQKIIDFLIISHLMMPHLSQRRDLEDRSLIIRFAQSVETPEKLRTLLLLTWGDIRAVGPEAWTDWKGSLLQSLYTKTMEVVLSKDYSAEKLQERIKSFREGVMESLGKDFNEKDILSFISNMPPRYFFAIRPKNVLEHFKLYLGAKKDQVVTTGRYVESKGLHRIQIYTSNNPHVLSLVTGIMLAFAVNILRAEVFPTRDGHLLLRLNVTHQRGADFSASPLFDEIRENLFRVLTGQTKVEELIAKRQDPLYLQKNPVQKAQNRVNIDNDVSAYYTVIDVYTYDRLGLLYDITRTLNREGCYIEVSKISTKVEQVTDIFYVKDIFGQKITAKEKLASIKDALLKILS